MSPENNTAETDQVKVEVRQFHMGMIVSLTVYADSMEAGRAACRSAFALVAKLDQDILSDYAPDSEVRTLARERGRGPVMLSPELSTVLAAGLQLAEETGGRFDPTARPMIEVWREARKRRSLPDPDRLLRARERTGFRRLHLDMDTRALSWSGPTPELDLGAIAKGYIGDQVLDRLRDQGCPRAMFAAGGDFVLGDPPVANEGWPVSLPGEKEETLYLSNCAISVSGDTSQFLEYEGITYSHVIDARTGRALTHRRSCVVIAPTGMQSDALATAGTLLDPDAHRDLLRRYAPSCRAWILPAPVNPGSGEPGLAP